MAYHFLIFAVLFSCLAYSSYSYQFVAGGSDGWVVNPSVSYNQWAQRMRFQVNDTILFRYKSGSDSVMEVNKDDYDKCNVANPLLKLDDGNSVFKFDRPGPFYFISGNKTNCDQGQKLAVVVITPRTPPSTPKNVPPPTAAPPKGSSPPSPAAGAGPATSPSQSGGASAPATSPSSTSPSGGATAPATSPSSPSGGAPAPATSPSSLAPAPAGSGAGEGPSPAGDMPGSPSGSTMPGSPSGSTMPGSPGSSMPGASGPGSGAAGDANSPPAPPGSVAAPPCSISVLMMLSVGLGVFVFSH